MAKKIKEKFKFIYEFEFLSPDRTVSKSEIKVIADTEEQAVGKVVEEIETKKKEGSVLHFRFTGKFTKEDNNAD